MFKIGDIVVFIGFAYSHYESHLTINKKYYVEDINGSYLILRGENFNYHYKLFKDITDLRKDKIKKICNLQ